ncbi:MAG TPA: cytochrome c peroxidase [bacterium]|nr:cytochrome c peroxidase [bacterium]HPO99696.1 cytochrome c peroxidase [bacterium]HXK92179.1 cytochrome c peroxidase [bacterium]
MDAQRHTRIRVGTLLCLAAFLGVPDGSGGLQAAASGGAAEIGAVPLGLPPVEYPADNPQTPAKIALGEKLFMDARFSSTGEVSCSTCHDPKKVFTDSPLKVSEGIFKLTGTRNAPTVVNAAYMQTQFWDGRSPSLEDQALHPPVNPVEMGLKDHQPILDIVRTDPEYVQQFKEVFGKSGEAVTMTEVTQAIAAFERTIISGNSPFDRWFFGGEADAMTPQQIQGYHLFVNEGRCVSCHVIEQTQALFTDNRFHNIGVGINAIQHQIPKLAREFLKAEATASEVDKKVLTDKRTSELGRFAISRKLDDIGSFKTPTLRNVAKTAPYMHDGSLATLREVMEHYNNGGVTEPGDPVNDFLSSGIRPLNLNDEEIDALVAFMEALTSPEYAQ